jgi:Flp pilus assembly protein TadG
MGSENLMISFGKNKKNIRRSPRELGQAIVLYAVGMVALIAVIGLATDAAMIYKTKQDLQRAVDSAALAGAYKLPKKDVATSAVYEFMRLHGYNPTPANLTINFPNDAVQKIVHVEATTDASYFFLRVLGFNTMTVSAVGESEAAPSDIILVLDLSQSMVYDTPKPTSSEWGGFTGCTRSDWDPVSGGGQAICIAKWCNFTRKCDPLDKYIKVAANNFVDQFDDRYDRIGLVTYNITATQIIPLSSNFSAVKTAINNVDAFEDQNQLYSWCPIWKGGGSDNNKHVCYKNTNIGDAIMYAHNSIAAAPPAGGRIDSIWSIVLLTDGKANIYRTCSSAQCPYVCGANGNCQPNFSTNTYACAECTPPSGQTLPPKNFPTASAYGWAVDNAIDTWKRNETSIYTIAYGDTWPDYKDLMIEVADWTDDGYHNDSTTASTNGNFWGALNVNELNTAFVQIASRIYARLLK